MTRLITFATDNMSIAAQICKESALANNVDEARAYGPGDIDKEFVASHKSTFADVRGFGYWVWKPYLINRELKSMQDGDILIYADAGVELINNVNHIIDRMKNDVWVFGNMWQHEHWCKMDVIKRVFPNGQFDKQVQASVIFFRASRQSRKIVEDWLYYCGYKDLIDDSTSVTPNHPEFREHRHDQAILTCLVYRDKLPLHWWPAMYNAGNFTYDKSGYTDTYPVLFHHHRMRNEDFSAGDELNRLMQNYFKRKYKINPERGIKENPVVT